MTIFSHSRLIFSLLVVILFAAHRTICYDSKIVGGRLISLRNVPFIVSLQRDPQGHFCGGTLLSLSSVLTGCHCVGMLTAGTMPKSVRLREIKSLTVQAGSEILPDNSTDGQRVKIERIIFHPNCSYVQYMMYDFAILTLIEDLKPNPRVQPVNLFSRDKAEYDSETLRIQTDSKASCFVAGWGMNDDRFPSDSTSLRAIQMRIISDGHCRQKLGRENSKFLSFNFWNNAQMCTLPHAEHENASDCTGDSGGPFFCGKYIFGVVSYGYDCGYWDTPNVYAKVADFVDWYNMLEAERVFDYQLDEKSSIGTVRGTCVALVLSAMVTILNRQIN